MMIAGIKKFIQFAGQEDIFASIKKYFQSSRRRAEILAEARELMVQMGEHWAEEAGKPIGERAELLMRIGLAQLFAIKAGRELAQKIAQQFAEGRWAPVKEAHRN